MLKNKSLKIATILFLAMLSIAVFSQTASALYFTKYYILALGN